MDETIHVRPVAGGTVRHPDTGLPLPPEGARLRPTPQVRRYLRRGDLELVPEKSDRSSPETRRGKE